MKLWKLRKIRSDRPGSAQPCTERPPFFKRFSSVRISAHAVRDHGLSLWKTVSTAVFHRTYCCYWLYLSILRKVVEAEFA